MPRPIRSTPHAILLCSIPLCTLAVAAIIVGPPARARLTDSSGWSLQNASYVGGLSQDELDDVSMYDIDRELYGDEAVGAGRTYSDDADRFIRPEPQPTPAAPDTSKNGMLTRHHDPSRGPRASGQSPSRLAAGAQADAITALLGGSDDDVVHGVAVARDGSVWVVGSTYSPDFPLVKPLQAKPGGNGSDIDDAFVAQLSPDLRRILYSSYLGGRDFEEGAAIALTADGSPVVVGQTASADFPTRGGPGLAAPCSTRPATCPDVFVTKLSPDGQELVWSTVFGGQELDAAYDVGLDAADRVYLTGHTVSHDFPVPGGLQTRNAGGTCGGSARRDCEEAFVTVLDADGGRLAWSTYLGGRGDDRGRSLAVDPTGNVYVTGRTGATDFPTTANAFQARPGGGTCMGVLERLPCTDAFLASIDRDGKQLRLGSYLGGRSDDEGFGVAVDAAGRVAVIGKTASPNFPVQDALQPSLAGGDSDAFFTVLDASSAIAFSTFLGSATVDEGRGVAAIRAADGTAAGFAIAGLAGRGFPAFQPLPDYAGGDSDAFIGHMASALAAPTLTPPTGGSPTPTTRPGTAPPPTATAGPLVVRSRVYLPLCQSR